MKSIKFLLSVLIIALFFSFFKSDDETLTATITVDFENVVLAADSLSSDTSFVSSDCIFYGDKTKFWNGGILCSSHNNITTAGYKNQYSVYAGSGAYSSTKFAIVYGTSYFLCDSSLYSKSNIKSMMITNSTYAYLDMKNGSNYSKKFTTDDWFMVTITGYYKGIRTASVDYYLADFRNGKSFISNSWNKVDLSSLGKVNKVTFEFNSSDIGNWGMNTPAYCCIDNIEFAQTVSQK